MTNTTNDVENIALQEEGGGDFGDFVSKNTPREAPQIVRGAVDQFRCHRVLVAQAKNAAWIKVEELYGSGKDAQKVLADAGIIAMSATMRQLGLMAETWPEYDSILVADRPGWVGSHYVLGDGSVFSPLGEEANLLNLVVPSEKFSIKGNTREWLNQITPLVAHQDAMLVALSFAFLPPVLELLRTTSLSIQNPILDACGPTSTGKSTVFIRLPGSVWGGSDADTGFGESWNTTKGGVDLLVAGHNSTFLGLDETNLAGETPTEQAKAISHAVYMISNGGPRVSKVQTLPKRPSSLVCISTSNLPLTRYLKNAGGSRGAVEVRFVSITIPSSNRFGVLSVIPDEFASSGDVIEAVNLAVTNFYGAPIRKFLVRLVQERHLDRKKLIQEIRKNYQKFIDSIGVRKGIGSDFRKARPFALAYSISVLARRWGCLPKKNLVGSYLQAFKTIWSWTLPNAIQTTRASPWAILKRHVSENRKSFISAKDPAKMSDEDFQNCKGFKRSSVAGRKELVMSPHKFKAFGFSNDDVLNLRKKGLLIGEKGDNARNDTKRIVRLNLKGRRVKDRVFVIQVDKLIKT